MCSFNKKISILTLIPTLKLPFKGLSKSKDWSACPPSQGLQLFKTGSHRDGCVSSHLLTLAAHKEMDEGTVLCLASPTEECGSDRPPSVFSLCLWHETVQPACLSHWETLHVCNKQISCAQAAVRRCLTSHRYNWMCKSCQGKNNRHKKSRAVQFLHAFLSAKRISLEGKVNRSRLKQVQH